MCPWCVEQFHFYILLLQLACVSCLAEIREAFKVFDRDGNGFISKQELGMAMRSLGYMPNEVELEVIIQRLDMDGDGQVDFEEFVTLLGPKLTAAGMPDKFHGTDFDSVFWKCDMQKLTVEELKRLLYDTFCDHLSMKDIENIIMTEENHIENPEDCQVDIDSKEGPPILQTVAVYDILHAFLEICIWFQPDTASQANLCAQEPDMRLCDCFHYQRNAHCGQSGTAERHEIGAAAFSALTTT
ncbi:Calcium-binding protein 7 [Collichthys lucidus]|uniref:Calcium-binding protein 7 n=1 Tax=Collichthys lucidus TaxID=240159 RepID=A0A4U5UXJ8_COLLU|nr:Calcium-binding protein 7 [Collichthys lucidus]